MGCRIHIPSCDILILGYLIVQVGRILSMNLRQSLDRPG